MEDLDDNPEEIAKEEFVTTGHSSDDVTESECCSMVFRGEAARVGEKVGSAPFPRARIVHFWHAWWSTSEGPPGTKELTWNPHVLSFP